MLYSRGYSVSVSQIKKRLDEENVYISGITEQMKTVTDEALNGKTTSIDLFKGKMA